ncbi:MAG: hypothetical protein A2033_14805 [Bacteroidetes bacterium GWA2_31_9]|nr:MAG: hypothetical protein A2033_14805 [Bacteroidetes bacterium GWA2_31_9]
MDSFFEILKYILPAGIVFIATYFFAKSFFDNESQKRRLEYKSNNQKLITPVRLQAYERLTLLLERISPESLIMRCQSQGMTVKQLQSDLLSVIRAEFDHNLSQQIYVSPQTWEIIKSTRENIVKLVNSCSDGLNADAPAIELSRRILETVMANEKNPTAIALDFLKAEVKQFI